MKARFLFITILAIITMLVAGCTGPAVPSPTPTPDATTPVTTPTTEPPDKATPTGTLRVLVTDAPPEYTVTSVVVHFSEVWVHKAVAEQEQEQQQEGGGEQVQQQEQEQQQEQDGEGEWIKLTITGGTFDTGYVDLAELRDEEAKIELAADELAAGKYTQLLVILDEELGVKVDYLENPEDEPVTATLPSGKLRFVRPIEVVADEDTEILLDFDLLRSLTFAGSGKGEEVKIIVKPVVKFGIQQGGKPHELTSVEGTISAVDTEGSTVSIIPTGGTEDDIIVLNVNPQQTAITLDGEEVSLSELAEAITQAEANTVTATASYYPDNLKAESIDAESPQG